MGFEIASDLGVKDLAPANLQKCVGGFLLYKFRRIFLGIFLEDFFGHFFFPTKMRKNPVRKSAEKSGGSKTKIHEKSVLPKAGPKRPQVHVAAGVDSEDTLAHSGWSYPTLLQNT